MQDSKYGFLILCLVISSILFSCGSGHLCRKRSDQIVTKSQNEQPKWSEKEYKNDTDNYHFMNYIRTEKNEIEGLRLAKDELLQKITGRINDHLKEYLSERISSKEKSTIFKVFSDALLEQMKIKVIIPDASYYEKLKNDDQTCYCCYVYKVINKEILNNKIRETIMILEERYSDDDNMISILSRLKKQADIPLNQK
ncbi:MAG: hypothetical protein KKH98_11255 [Spirochaetes bacterium]|nr:hypothetical protein [Spirochaetota bacterium]